MSDQKQENDKQSGKGQDRSVNINAPAQQFSVSTGDNNPTTNVFTGDAQITQNTSEFIDALRKMSEVFIKLQLDKSQHHQIAEAFQEAEKEASSEKPDKKKISTWLEQALTIAKTANNIKDLAVTATPFVTTAAAWLGDAGSKLLSLLS